MSPAWPSPFKVFQCYPCDTFWAWALTPQGDGIPSHTIVTIKHCGHRRMISRAPYGHRAVTTFGKKEADGSTTDHS